MTIRLFSVNPANIRFSQDYPVDDTITVLFSCNHVLIAIRSFSQARQALVCFF